MNDVRFRERIEQKIDDLCLNFKDYLNLFERENLFTGPCLYFHFKTLHLREKHPNVEELLGDEEFIESLYATLTAWGMHRLGQNGSKLNDFAVVRDSLQKQKKLIKEIEIVTIDTLVADEVTDVSNHLWKIIEGLDVSATNSKLVAGAKTMHHILPDLVPPIDRSYTLQFFYDQMNPSMGEELAFKEMFPYFREVVLAHNSFILSQIGRGMNTSMTKVVDNAIVGYGRKHNDNKKKNTKQSSQIFSGDKPGIHNGRRGNKYSSLEEHLSKIDQDIIRMSFKRIEEINGRKLPESAYIHRAWWGNHAPNPQAAWVRAGYRVYKLNLENELVIFKKERSIRDSE